MSASTWQMQDAVSRIHTNAEWNDEYGQYVVSYTNGDKERKIWVENKDSIIKKLELVDKYDLKGTAYWRLGFETQDVWSEI